MRRQKVIVNHKGGFTLVELVVVIAILGILVAVAVPQFESTFHKQQLESAADQIVANLNYARAMAIYTGQNYSVVFKESDMSCNVKRGDGTTEVDREILLDKLVKELVTADGKITYQPKGTLYGDEYRIKLTGKSGHGIEIVIAAMTGRVRIEEQ